MKQTMKDKGGHHLDTASTKLVWLGFAFEMLCLKHEEVIRRKLGLHMIPAVTGSFYAYDMVRKKRTAQIDLLFDRADKTVTICEIKYHNSELTLTKKDKNAILEKKNALQAHLTTKRKIRRNFLVVYITMKGLRRNAILNELQPQVIVLEDLFRR